MNCQCRNHRQYQYEKLSHCLILFVNKATGKEIKALSTLSFIASTKATVAFLTLSVVVTTIIMLSHTTLFAVVEAFNLMLMEGETADTVRKV